MALDIFPISALGDNYVWVLRDAATGVTAVVDPAVAETVEAALDGKGLRPDLILNTHHHADHIGGNAALRTRFGSKVVAPVYDRERIPADRYVGEGDEVAVGSERLVVWFVPGHTRGHIAYYGERAQVLFCGDTLFSMGCGRLFEGTPAEMHASLSRLAALPEATSVYCAHEYTEANGRFALAVDGNNPDLQRRCAEVRELRAGHRPTLPSTIGLERRTNPFLRARDVADFARLRAMKDSFR